MEVLSDARNTMMLRVFNYKQRELLHTTIGIMV